MTGQQFFSLGGNYRSFQTHWGCRSTYARLHLLSFLSEDWADRDLESKDLRCWHDIGNWMSYDSKWNPTWIVAKSHFLRSSEPNLIWFHHQKGDMFASSILLRNASRRAVTTSRSVVTVTGVMGREIIDSRGNPTVEVDVHTTAGRFRGT